MKRRITKVAKEINVGVYTIIDFLNSIGYDIRYEPNCKLDEDMYSVLLHEFKYDLKLKEKAHKIYVKTNDINPKTVSIEDIIVKSSDNIKKQDSKKPELKPVKFSEQPLIKDNPRVFISYSWDNEDHKIWVETFARKLMSNGIVTILDQYELTLGDNLQFFMEKYIPEVDKVIMILTPNYKLKAEKRFGGVGYEYSIITQEMFNDQNTNKFIPIQLKGELEECVPTFLKSRLCLDMRNDKGYKSGLKQIIFSVYNKRLIEKPTLGKIPDFTNLQL